MQKIITLGLTALGFPVLVSLCASSAFAAKSVSYVVPVEPELPEQACEHRFAWHDDIAAHVLAGPLDGSFNYDFAGSAIDNIVGSYDDAQQSAWWNVMHADDSYLVDTFVTGSGSMRLDGDVKMTLTTTTTDALGQVWFETESRTRNGCQESRVIDPDDLALSHTGEWSAGRYDFTEQRPLIRTGYQTSLIADVSGTRYADGSSDATAIYQSFGPESSTSIIVTEQRNFDGERWLTLDLSSADAGRETSVYIAPDGTTTKSGYFGDDPRIEYAVTLDYAGNGTGWYEDDGYERYCYVEIADGGCKRSCWDLEDIEELEEEYEDQDLEFEFEYGDYLEGLEPAVAPYCHYDALLELYAITPY